MPTRCFPLDSDLQEHIITHNFFQLCLNMGHLMLNRVKEIRESLLMSKTELARKAGVSPITIDRIERGTPCRLETMRKIILALGLTLDQRNRVFPEE